MKRFIDLGCQTGNTEEGVKQFAFFDTVFDVFETFSGSCCWSSREDFITDYVGEDLQRYLNLIPDDWNVKYPPNDWKNAKVILMGKEMKNIKSINYEELVSLSNLESDLIEAVNDEDYDLAASLRDQINTMKKATK